MVGTIDGTHFDIKKPKMIPIDYIYFKTGGYSIQGQATMDRNKKFLDVVVGMLGSFNDSHVLKCSSLY